MLYTLYSGLHSKNNNNNKAVNVIQTPRVWWIHSVEYLFIYLLLLSRQHPVLVGSGKKENLWWIITSSPASQQTTLWLFLLSKWYIISFLTNLREVVKLRFVCRRLRSVCGCQTPSLWREFIWPRYDNAIHDTILIQLQQIQDSVQYASNIKICTIIP